MAKDAGAEEATRLKQHAADAATRRRAMQELHSGGINAVDAPRRESVDTDLKVLNNNKNYIKLVKYSVITLLEINKIRTGRRGSRSSALATASGGHSSSPDAIAAVVASREWLLRRLELLLPFPFPLPWGGGAAVAVRSAEAVARAIGGGGGGDSDVARRRFRSFPRCSVVTRSRSASISCSRCAAFTGAAAAAVTTGIGTGETEAPLRTLLRLFSSPSSASFASRVGPPAVELEVVELTPTLRRFARSFSAIRSFISRICSSSACFRVRGEGRSEEEGDLERVDVRRRDDGSALSSERREEDDAVVEGHDAASTRSATSTTSK